MRQASNKCHTIDTKIRTSAASDHNLAITILKCIRSKYTSYEKIKINSSGISRTMYHDNSYYLMFVICYLKR